MIYSPSRHIMTRDQVSKLANFFSKYCFRAISRGVQWEDKNINYSLRRQLVLLYSRKLTSRVLLPVWSSCQFDHGPQQDEDAAMWFLLRRVCNKSWGCFGSWYSKPIYMWWHGDQSWLGLWFWTKSIIWSRKVRWIGSWWDSSECGTRIERWWQTTNDL